jgi:hypothetical protein
MVRRPGLARRFLRRAGRRWVIKDTAGRELPPPAWKTVDLEGRLVKDGVRKAIRDRQNALTDLVHAIWEYRKLADKRPLTLQGSDYVQSVQEQGGRLTIQSSRQRQVIDSRVLQYGWLKFGDQANRAHKAVYDVSGDLRGEKFFPPAPGTNPKDQSR